MNICWTAVTSNPDGAALNQLILNGVLAKGNPGALGAKSYESRAPYIEVVVTRDEGTNFPSYLTVNLNEDEDVAVGLVLTEANEVVGCDGDISAVDKRGPHILFLVTLVRGWD